MSSNDKYTVIIGETGSGKSTFINYVANYCHKGSLDRPYIAIPTTYFPANMGYNHNEHSVHDRTKSKTVDCQRYSFKLGQIKFHFIDTPGINDTGGLLQDSENVEKVFSQIMNIVELTALVLILNGTAPRVTTNIKNVLGIYRDRLPDSIYSNMIIVLTNCEEHSVNFNPVDVGLPGQCSLFHMQNSAFSSNPKTWSNTTFAYLQHDFNLSMQKMNSFFKKLLSLQPASTKLFKDMSDERNRIQQQLYQARMTILDLQNTEDALAAFEISVGIHEANAEKFQNFIRERKVVQTKKIKTDYYNTRCSTCDITCHRNCSPHEVGQWDSKYSSRCSAMDIQGFCQMCPGHCYVSRHFQARYITEKVMVSVNDIVGSMQQQYLQAKQGLKDADAKCNDLQTSKKLLQNALQQQYQEVRESISKLQQTCKDSNITGILFQFIELLERDAVNLKSHSAIANSNKFITNLKHLCSVSGQLSDTQQVMSSQPTDRFVQNNSNSRTHERDYGNSLANNETNVRELSYRQNNAEFSSKPILYPSLSKEQRWQSNVNDDHNIHSELYYDLYEHNHEVAGREEKKDELKVTSHAGTLKQEQNVTRQNETLKPEQNITSNAGTLRSEQTITTHEGILNPEQNTTRHKGSLKPEQNIKSYEGSWKPEQNITSHEEALKPEQNITSHGGTLKPEQNITSHEEALKPEQNITTHEGTLKPKQDITNYGGSLRPEQNVTIFGGTLKPEQNITSHEEALKPEQNITSHAETLKQEQNITDEGLNFKHELTKENLIMLPLNKLLQLLNNIGDNPAVSDIKNELQQRCSGESIGFLTLSEHIILCDQYTKYQQMKFKELVRLHVHLDDEVSGITGGDPLKINLIPVEKRLQLAAINLLIKKKD